METGRKIGTELGKLVSIDEYSLNYCNHEFFRVKIIPKPSMWAGGKVLSTQQRIFGEVFAVWEAEAWSELEKQVAGKANLDQSVCLSGLQQGPKAWPIINTDANIESSLFATFFHEQQTHAVQGLGSRTFIASSSAEDVNSNVVPVVEGGPVSQVVGSGLEVVKDTEMLVAPQRCELDSTGCLEEMARVCYMSS